MLQQPPKFVPFMVNMQPLLHAQLECLEEKRHREWLAHFNKHLAAKIIAPAEIMATTRTPTQAKNPTPKPLVRARPPHLMSSGRWRPNWRQAVRTALASLEDSEAAAKVEGSTWPRRRRCSIRATHSGHGCAISTAAGAFPARARPLLSSSKTWHCSLWGGRGDGL